VCHPAAQGRSALDAVGVARKRCWDADWVIDLDIKAFFDSLSHELVERAVAHHTKLPWVRLYIARWLRAPVQRPDGTLEEGTKGTPQGGVISPLWPTSSCIMRSTGGCRGSTRASDSSAMRTTPSSTAGASARPESCWKPSPARPVPVTAAGWSAPVHPAKEGNRRLPEHALYDLRSRPAGTHRGRGPQRAQRWASDVRTPPAELTGRERQPEDGGPRPTACGAAAMGLNELHRRIGGRRAGGRRNAAVRSAASLGRRGYRHPDLRRDCRVPRRVDRAGDDGVSSGGRGPGGDQRGAVSRGEERPVDLDVQPVQRSSSARARPGAGSTRRRRCPPISRPACAPGSGRVRRLRGPLRPRPPRPAAGERVING
jgi:Reverse transcriptase (RNA-dependent DNA polymerase)